MRRGGPRSWLARLNQRCTRASVCDRAAGRLGAGAGGTMAEGETPAFPVAGIALPAG